MSTDPCKVVLLDPNSADNLAYMQEFAPAVQLYAPQSADAEELLELLPGAKAIVSKKVYVDDSVMRAAGDSLGFIQLWSGQRSYLDLEAAKRQGISAACMPQVGCIAVAEMTMLLMLGLSKKIVQADQSTRSGAYRDLGLTPEETAERKHAFQWMKLPDLFELYGKTLGLVGGGEIASEVAKRARAFGMQVLYTKRQRLPEDIDREIGWHYASLEQLLAESDVLSLHVPHTAETDKLIDTQALAKMKPSAYLINTCRGGVVDEDALWAALTQGKLAGAGLDVYRYEPVPYDHPLLALENVLLAPHLGGGSGGARMKQTRDVMSNIERWRSGQPYQHALG